MRFRPLLLVFLLLIPTVGHGKPPSGDHYATRGDLGVGTVDEDLFLLTRLEQHFRFDAFTLVLAAPLRIRLWDRAPNDKNGIRNQDWDEPSEWTRIVRELTVTLTGKKGGAHLAMGELSGVALGYGALVDHYFNATDMDHYKGGLTFRGEWQHNGFEILIDDVARPRLLFGRLFAAPLSWFFDHPIAAKLELGLSMGAGLSLPTAGGSGATESLPAGALDLSFQAVDLERFALTPYVELGLMKGDVGFHGGLDTGADLLGQDRLWLHLRLEYRRLEGAYRPALFNPFYDYRKHYWVSSATSPSGYDTLQDALEASPRTWRHGFMTDLLLDILGTVRLGFRYDRTGDRMPHWLLARASFHWKDEWSAALFYGGDDTNGGAGLFSTRSLMGAELLGPLGGPFHFFVEFTRRPRDIPNAATFANENGVGLGISASY